MRVLTRRYPGWSSLSLLDPAPISKIRFEIRCPLLGEMSKPVLPNQFDVRMVFHRQLKNSALGFAESAFKFWIGKERA